MIVLVCGGRDYDGDVRCLSEIEIDILIHGACKGADLKAAGWARTNGIHVAAIPALWEVYGESLAGTLRNEVMALLNIEYCVAFPGGSGTRDMVSRMQELGVTVWKPYGC